MARFRFSLEQLLVLRRLEEDRARRTFLIHLRNFRLKENEIVQLSRRREEAKDRCRESPAGSLDIEEALRSRRYINVLFQQIAGKKAELAGLRKPLDQGRSAYRKSTMRRRVLEKLREKRWREFQREEERRERRDLDEIGQVGFLRARAEAGRPAPAGGVEP